MSEKIVLIDGHSILNRAFYGVPDLTNSEGMHTNAVYGFLNIMFRFIDEEKPDYITVAFDLSAPTFRHKEYAAYKGTRKPMAPELKQQVPLIKDREVSAPGSYWENGHWVEIPAMSIKREYNFDQVGQKDMYLLHHEEIESLAKNIPEAKRIRFFMTFGQSYLDHMRCLEDVGMLSTTPVNFNGQEIVPIQFLKALLPDPASLGPRTKGKTNIGCIFTGKKDGKEKTYYIYNVCDHQECYKEVGSQAISYTTGVPAMCGALMLLTGKWTTKGVHTVEEFDPDPYLDALDKYGLPRSESHSPALVD